MRLKNNYIKTSRNQTDEHLLHLPPHKGSEEPFRVPDNYFDSLTSRIQDRISARQSRVSVLSSMSTILVKKKVWIPVIACVLILLSVFILYPGKSSQNQGYISKTDTVAVKANDINGAYALETQYIEIEKALEQIKKLPVSHIDESVVKLPDEIKNEDIIKYLNEEEIDPNLLADL
jgi:hypothetical protein